MKRKCKICEGKIKKKSNSEVEFCSSSCYVEYINSKEFDKEFDDFFEGLQKSKNEKGDNI